MNCFIYLVLHALILPCVFPFVLLPSFFFWMGWVVRRSPLVTDTDTNHRHRHRHRYRYRYPTRRSSLIAHDVILNIDVNDINVNRQLDDNDNDNGNASTSTSMTSTTLRQNSDHSPSITGFSFGVLSDPRVSLVRTDDNNYYFVLSSDRSYRLLQTPGKPLWLFGASPTGSGVYEGRTSDLWVGRDDSLRGS